MLTISKVSKEIHNSTLNINIFPLHILVENRFIKLSKWGQRLNYVILGLTENYIIQLHHVYSCKLCSSYKKSKTVCVYLDFLPRSKYSIEFSKNSKRITIKFEPKILGKSKVEKELFEFDEKATLAEWNNWKIFVRSQNPFRQVQGLQENVFIVHRISEGREIDVSESNLTSNSPYIGFRKSLPNLFPDLDSLSSDSFRIVEGVQDSGRKNKEEKGNKEDEEDGESIADGKSDDMLIHEKGDSEFEMFACSNDTKEMDVNELSLNLRSLNAASDDDYPLCMLNADNDSDRRISLCICPEPSMEATGLLAMQAYPSHVSRMRKWNSQLDLRINQSNSESFLKEFLSYGEKEGLVRNVSLEEIPVVPEFNDERSVFRVSYTPSYVYTYLNNELTGSPPKGDVPTETCYPRKIPFWIHKSNSCISTMQDAVESSFSKNFYKNKINLFVNKTTVVVASEPWIRSLTNERIKNLADRLYHRTPFHEDIDETIINCQRPSLNSVVPYVLEKGAFLRKKKECKAKKQPESETKTEKKMNNRLKECCPLSLAKELTMIDQELFSAVEAEEVVRFLMKPASFNRNTCPNLWNFLSFFQRVSNLVASEILQSNYSSARANKLAMFIDVASRCSQIQNYHSARSVLTGIICFPVARLRKTWFTLMALYPDHYGSVKNLENEYLFSKICLDTGPTVPFFGDLMKYLLHGGIFDAEVDSRAAKEMDREDTPTPTFMECFRPFRNWFNRSSSKHLSDKKDDMKPLLENLQEYSGIFDSENKHLLNERVSQVLHVIKSSLLKYTFPPHLAAQFYLTATPYNEPSDHFKRSKILEPPRSTPQ